MLISVCHLDCLILLNFTVWNRKFYTSCTDYATCYTIMELRRDSWQRQGIPLPQSIQMDLGSYLASS